MTGFPITASILAALALILTIYKTVHFVKTVRYKHPLLWLHFPQRNVMQSSSTASSKAKRQQNALSSWILILLVAAFFSFFMFP